MEIGNQDMRFLVYKEEGVDYSDYAENMFTPEEIDIVEDYKMKIINEKIDVPETP